MNTQNKSILFIFSGLPATGKSTLSKFIAQKYNAAYLRIDTIEQSLKDLCGIDVQGEGYGLAYKIGSDNLKIGINVVSDSCNSIELTRRDWEKVAQSSHCDFINIETICSDKKEHQQRAESRVAEVENLKIPDWESIQNCEFHQWREERIIIDTAHKTIKESEDELYHKIEDYLSDKKS
ncbi:MAG: AAA family ATPase [Chryseobacterium sp.]|jgi:predicted kinase|uniref:AAA family ATPase n=1 Tax=Chryseobacterium sp. TaxID=1871047 RepID=UPI002830F9C0|nr:AAA family ATPase [Chryseobacterium sp.]MDR2235017.1 AAA family ATPase [Chryseobacterium sp.]